ncbi:hypothetical protein HJ067_19640 [Vibrio parahaemolyticus]|uniref:hypothetical protein n=1 Tax=Vibrio parahaemolyticus TaxID=670 RepID=UPI000420C353|nr:hypothetical protein [Vibrio parahaemolyticus]MBE4295259.1 hypothetical protein [Vibrio parahaemolyticus]
MISTVTIEVSPEEAHLHLLQRQREEEAKRYAREKARKRQQQIANMGLYADLDGTRKEVQSQLDKAINGFEEFIEGKHHSLSKTGKLIPLFKALTKKDREALVSDALDTMLNSVDNVSVTGVIHRLGDLVELSLNYVKEREANSQLTQSMKRMLEQQSTSGGRMKTLRYQLRMNQQTWSEWDQNVKVTCGQILFCVIMESTDLFDTETREVNTNCYF